MKEQKILLFTHGIDIDGYGCAILAKLAWQENVDIVFADNFDLDDKFILETGKSGFKNYTKIFVTDHCFGIPLCNMIAKNPNLCKKIKIFDHHASRIGKQDQFNWIKIVDGKPNKKECGTSLFYKFLIKKALITPSQTLDEFVELTRLYDTWQWTKSHNQSANMLNTIAMAIGRDEYIELMLAKFAFNEEIFSYRETKIISDYQKEFNKKLNEYINKIEIIQFGKAKAGFVEIKDLFKNDIAKKVREIPIGKELDFMLMPLQDRPSVSLRNVKPNFDVSQIANQYGGGGHKGAASFPKENMPKIINNIKVEEIKKI